MKRECIWFPVCPMKKYAETGLIDDKWVSRYCRGSWENCIRYQMESRGEYHPDNMMPDGRIDENLS